MKPIILAILDGFGIREEIHGNAIKQATTPNFNYLCNNYPHSLLSACGEDVGLPVNQMGNSEVGHLNIGAGRIVIQPLQMINNSIKDNTFFANKNLLKVINHVNNNNSKLHIMGLCSDGGVHAHIHHILSLIDMAKQYNINKLFVHLFLDGRDSLPNDALKYINIIETKLKDIGLGTIASISGRYYAMDRDDNYDRTKIAYDAIVNGKSNANNNINGIILDSYKNKIYDEFIKPAVINENGLIEDNDGIIHANFRTERANQLLRTLVDDDFNEFKIKKLVNIKIVLLMPSIKLNNLESAFNAPKIENGLGEYLSSLNYKQLRIAETEKYAHVTYFFDGLKDLGLNNYTKILINSPKVETYDLKPEMSAYEVTDELIKQIKSQKHDIVILNYANPDMVGHSGKIIPTIKAINAVDECLGKIYHVIKEFNGTLIVTSDHGNAEHVLDDNNNPITTHTLNKVPFILCNKNYKLNDGRLSDIAPTILKLLGEKIPDEMTGKILIEN